MIKFFTIQEPHENFELEAYSEVILDGQKPAWPSAAPSWDEVVKGLPWDKSPSGMDAYQFVFESPRVRPNAEFAAYAAPVVSARSAHNGGIAGL